MAAPDARVLIALRTSVGMNAREHWGERSRRVARERETVGWWLRANKLQPPQPPAVVRLTRQGPSNGLDDDNLRGSLKAVRDEIAAWIGVDDRDPAIRWEYGQRRSPMWAVLVEIFVLRGEGGRE